MKNILFIIVILMSSPCFAQSYKVGKIDADGNPTLSADANKCSDILNQVSAHHGMKQGHATDFSFTKLSHGQICLTGYEKDASGNIIRGVRVQCSQDDETNLIVFKNSFSENISGKPFNAAANQN